jgi:hypothetical protein
MNRISLCLFMAIRFVYLVLCHLGWGRVWTWVYDPPMTFMILSGRRVGNTGCPAKSSTKGGHPNTPKERSCTVWGLAHHAVWHGVPTLSVCKVTYQNFESFPNYWCTSRDCRLTGYFIINMWKCYLLFELSCTWQSPFWEANGRSAGQVQRLLLKPKFHYRVHNSPQPVPILSQMNPIRNLQIWQSVFSAFTCKLNS